MPDHELRALLHSYVAQVWTAGNLEAVDDYLAPDYRRHVRTMDEPLSREGQRELLRAFRTAFPDATLTVEEVVVERDLVAFRSTMRGTHRGDFRGIPPSDRPVQVQLVDMMRVRNGHIVEQWGGPDLLDLLEQLGASVSVSGAGTSEGNSA